MKFIYPAVFRKTENGTYHGFFPDLECCYADGDTLDDAIDNANEAAYNLSLIHILDFRTQTLFSKQKNWAMAH